MVEISECSIFHNTEDSFKPIALENFLFRKILSNFYKTEKKKQTKKKGSSNDTCQVVGVVEFTAQCHTYIENECLVVTCWC